MNGAKVEFPPLLDVGMHEMTLPDLRQLCVGNFPLSTTRGQFMRGIEALCGSLSTALLKTEVWVNGSFLTVKIDPRDADLVVKIPASLLSNASVEQQALIARIVNNEFLGCDCNIFAEYLHGDPNFAVGDMMVSYWKRQFGFSRGANFKGIAVIRTPLS